MAASSITFVYIQQCHTLNEVPPHLYNEGGVEEKGRDADRTQAVHVSHQ